MKPFWARLEPRTRLKIPIVSAETNYTLVDEPAAFRKLLDTLEDYDIAALDTEADSRHHYATRFCLIQITVGEGNWILDPLSELDITPLFKARAMQTLILHGSDFDLRMLYQNYGFLPKTIFDTMLAARLLGREKVGLANLVEEFFGVELKKDNQKADWTLRPLPQDMVDYAFHDTVYLHELAARLGDELEEKGRFLWHAETCATLLNHVRESSGVHLDRWRVDGSRHLDPCSLNLLKAIWEWRELAAEGQDSPPYKVMTIELMLAIVHSLREAYPAIDWATMPKLPRNFVGKRLETFTQAIERANELPESAWPEREAKAPKPSSVPVPELLVAMKCWRDECAEALSIEPSLLANRNQLVALCLPDKPTWNERYDDANLMAWQRGLWNEILLKNIGKGTP